MKQNCKRRKKSSSIRKISIFQRVGLSRTSLYFPCEYIEERSSMNAAAVLSYVLPYAPFTKYLVCPVISAQGSFLKRKCEKTPFAKKKKKPKAHRRTLTLACGKKTEKRCGWSTSVISKKNTEVLRQDPPRLILQPPLLNTSTPSVGVSTKRFSGTPSLFRLSKKLWHSPTTIIHSASARPVYRARSRLRFFGSIACMCCAPFSLAIRLSKNS